MDLKITLSRDGNVLASWPGHRHRIGTWWMLPPGGARTRRMATLDSIGGHATQHVGPYIYSQRELSQRIVKVLAEIGWPPDD